MLPSFVIFMYLCMYFTYKENVGRTRRAIVSSSVLRAVILLTSATILTPAPYELGF